MTRSRCTAARIGPRVEVARSLGISDGSLASWVKAVEEVALPDALDPHETADLANEIFEIHGRHAAPTALHGSMASSAQGPLILPQVGDANQGRVRPRRRAPPQEVAARPARHRAGSGPVEPRLHRGAFGSALGRGHHRVPLS